MDPMEVSSGYKQAGLILCSPNTINCTNFTNKNIMQSSSERKVSIWKLKYFKKTHLFQSYFVFYSYFLTFYHLPFVSNSTAYVKGKQYLLCRNLCLILEQNFSIIFGIINGPFGYIYFLMTLEDLLSANNLGSLSFARKAEKYHSDIKRTFQRVKQQSFGNLI